MTQQRRFTKEFEGEAVRMVESSGRTQPKIAGDLGIGLSTLVRWIGRSRDRRAVDPSATSSEVAAELSYNPVRPHCALDFTSPAQFEKSAAE
jgi:transposase